MKKNDRIGEIVHVVLVIAFVIGTILGLITLFKSVFPGEIASKPYISTQTVYMNTGLTPFDYLNINDKAWLVPLMYETLLEAKRFGEAKGEDNTIYMGRVVVAALDPSTRVVELNSGISSGASYKSENLYTFYLPDGKDIAEEKFREHTIDIGNEKYKITLLRIDTKNVTEENQKLSKYEYTFRVEQVIK